MVPCDGLGLARGRHAHVRKSGHRARSLSGGGAARALATRARNASRVGIDPPHLEGCRASDRALSFSTRQWCHALALASRAAGLRMCARAANARSLWGGGAARALAVRARHVTRVGLDPPTLEDRRASDRALSFGVRPWCHAPALASRAAGLRMCARAVIALALCGQEAQQARLPCARAAPSGIWNGSGPRRPPR